MPRKRTKSNLAEQMAKDIAFWKSMTGSFLALAVFAVHPLILNRYSSITQSKQSSFTFIVMFSVILLAVIALLAAATIPGCFRRRSPRELLRAIRPYEYALIAYWLVMLLSAFQADDMKEAFLGSSDRNEGLLMMSVYILAAVIMGRCYKPKRRELLVLAAVATLVAAYGICQYYGFDFLGIAPAGERENIGPALMFVSTMSNRNVVSSYLCLSFSVCAALFTQEHGGGRKEKLLGPAFLLMGWIQFYMLILGQTESGYVGLLLVFLILFPLIARTRRFTARLMVLLAGCLFLVWLSVRLHFEGWTPSYWASFAPYLLPAAAVLAVLAALLYFPPLPDTLPQTLFRIGWYLLVAVLIVAVIAAIPGLAETTRNPTLTAAREILTGNFQDALGSNRLYIWKRALTLIRDRPLLGYGPDNFLRAFEARFGAEGDALGLPAFDKAHNEYLQVLVDVGALGLLAQLSFFALVIASVRKRLREPMVMAVLLALACFMIQAFFNIFSPFAHPVAWVLWGFLAALAYRPSDDTPPATGKRTGKG